MKRKITIAPLDSIKAVVPTRAPAPIVPVIATDLKVIAPMSVLGKVYDETISDGYNDYASTCVRIQPGIILRKIGNRYYIDDIISLTRINADLVDQYNLYAIFAV